MSISLVRALRAFGLLRVIIAISLLHTSSSIRFHSVFSAMALTNSSSLSASPVQILLIRYLNSQLSDHLSLMDDIKKPREHTERNSTEIQESKAI
jgi:hypothetical protein